MKPSVKMQHRYFSPNGDGCLCRAGERMARWIEKIKRALRE